MIIHGRKARMTVTLSRELFERLQSLAELRDGNISAIVEECIVEKIGGLEMRAKILRDPLVDSVIQELLKPENISRARAIVGQDESDDLIVLRDKGISNARKREKRK